MNAVAINSTNPADSPATAILVIDDNHLVTRALSTLIRDAGYAPHAFHNGTDALAFIQSAANPGAAVVDIHLPDINGLILSQKLRERFGPDTPIVIMSGDTSIDTIRSLPNAGATYFFPKPVNSSALIERLTDLIENGPSADTA
ncbi:MAG TPA: response regulator [Tepidisphaeraceae bacterium]|nr:response regulator [Tepidisphaeraceae bacterium]